MGLSRKHHDELNCFDVSRKRLEQLRQRYDGDSIALQQIDVYDGATEYHDKLVELKDALKTGNTRKESCLLHWFKKHYPDI